MQGMEQTTLGPGPHVLQLGQPAGVPSHLWKRLAEKFLKGEPKVLGILQILVALMILGLGIIMMTLGMRLYDSDPNVFGLAYPAWGSVLFIVSGAFSVAAGIRTNKGLVQSSMGLNIASSVLASLGILFTVVSLSIFHFEYPHCIYSNMPDTCYVIMSILVNLQWSLAELYASPTINKIVMNIVPQVGMDALIIVLSLLEFCIAVSLSAFGCKVICCNRSGVVVIMPSSPPMAEATCPSFQGGLMLPVRQEKNDPENSH